MLFNSYIFIFGFLPLTLLVYSFLSKSNAIFALLWLIVASLFFYSWWKLDYLPIIVGSIIFNYQIGKTICKTGANKKILWMGISINLLLLGYYKYVGFFIENINHLFGKEIIFKGPVLPLAISFFTFQQIAYLVDCYVGQVKEKRFLNYVLFVSFFPQLIAGPIVHHRELMPQLYKVIGTRMDSKRFIIALMIFSLGLFKKVVIADSLADIANPFYLALSNGETLSTVEAWLGTLSYSFQLYFDFSGYSDMAIGLGYFFGIRLPLNFNAPYKAENIIEFWRRWHMTLSLFLRDYLYIPLGGNSKGTLLKYSNLMITMLLGGLWHGASWNFVIWGGIHGLYLLICHFWRYLKQYKSDQISFPTFSTFWARLLTFIAVLHAWVFFRASNIENSVDIIRSMWGISKIHVSHVYDTGFGDLNRNLLIIFISSLITFFFPTTMAFADGIREGKPNRIWGKMVKVCRTDWALAVFLTILTVTSIFYLDKPSEFLYFNF
jgi:D-alanyl-lipoteichoic acid acyltransferase DltB (MBOAT superfamily)